MEMHKIPTPKKHNSDKVMEMPEMLPMFHVSAKQMPQIKDWEVGKKYKMVIEVEQKSYSEHERGGNASFEILSYGIKDEDYDNMSDKDMEKMQAKGLSNYKK